MTENGPKLEPSQSMTLKEAIQQESKLDQVVMPHTIVKTIDVQTSLDNTNKIRPLHIVNTEQKISPELQRLIDLNQLEKLSLKQKLAQEIPQAQNSQSRFTGTIIRRLRRLVDLMHSLKKSLFDLVFSAIEKAFKFWIELKLLRLRKPSLFFRGVDIKDLRALPPEVRAKVKALRKKSRGRKKSLDMGEDKNDDKDIDDFIKEMIEKQTGVVQSEEKKPEPEIVGFSFDKDGKVIFNRRS